MKVKFKEAGVDLPGKYEVSFVLEEDRLALRGTFAEGSQVLLEFRGENSTKFYLVPTDVHDITAACVSFEEQKENDVQYYVSREGISGEYDLYLNIDNLKYAIKMSVKL